MISVFNEASVIAVFERNLEAAKRKLSELEICGDSTCNFRGLTGWIFERTIHYCLIKEFEALALTMSIQEEAPLVGRVRVDLLVGRAFIELKTAGCFSQDEVQKYARYREIANGCGQEFLFLTMAETYQPNRVALLKILGMEAVYFLDTDGDWTRLVRRLLELRDLK